MGELYGWTGKSFTSTSRRARFDRSTRAYVPDFVGGVGLAARIAWDMLATQAWTPLTPRTRSF